jgi:hypothetical protein
MIKQVNTRDVAIKVKKKICSRISWIHLLVFAFDSNQHTATGNYLRINQLNDIHKVSPYSESDSKIEYQEVLSCNDKQINELTDIDPWNISRSASIEMLQKKWRCFVAKINNRVVACNWSIAGQSFRDEYLGRKIQIGARESYFWRGFCSLSHRGHGVQGLLIQHAVWLRHTEDGCRHHITMVRANNQSVKRCLDKCGWKVVGHAGFIEVLGVRLHYILGHNAFQETKQRIYFQIRRRCSL